MKEIPLTQGKVALVDDEDFEKVSQIKWHADIDSNGRFNAKRHVRLPNGKETKQSMHRFLLGLERGDPRQVDHINRQMTLDNRRSNLRVTLNQNNQNRGKFKNNTSGFKGVSWREDANGWAASITANGERVHLGYFSTPELAADAYDAAASELHGDFAATNAMLEAA